MTVIKELGHTLGQEPLRKILRVLVRFAAIVLVLAIIMTLAIAGATRLADALAHACHRWIGDPIIADMVSGFALILIPLVILWIIRLRLLR